MVITGGDVFFTKKDTDHGRVRRRGFFKKADLYIDKKGRFGHFPGEIPDDSGEVIDAGDCYVIPGLVDVHTHGCAGCDFSDASPEGLKKMAAYLFGQGVTSFCPTSMTGPEERLGEVFASTEGMASAGPYARAVGIHMEGPFISMEKKGAQNPAYIRAPDIGLMERLIEASPVPVRLVTLAPELPGAFDFIDHFHKRIHISSGHTAADYETALEAFSRGADHVTHLYNAMASFGHRKPGLIGAAMMKQDVFAELICDGQHVHPAVVKASFQLFGADRIVMISDSMRAAGMPDGISELGGLTVWKKGEKATLEDGTLAGSVSSLMMCMRKAVSFGVPLEDAVLASTSTPALSIGMEEEIGTIRPGARGNAVILDRGLEIVRVL